MTISTTTNRVTYTGNGVTVAFSFPYAFFAQADLVVVETIIATGVQTTKALTTHYTIAGSVDALGHYSSGGTVTAVTAPASTVTWTIYRDPTATQTTDLVENDPMPAESLEAALDYQTMLNQRTRDIAARSLQQPEGDSATIDRLPAKVDRASKYLAFDADGDPVATAGTTSSYVVTPFMATVLDDTTAATALATLGIAVAAKGDLLVATAADTIARKAVGTNGYLLTADSAQADGLNWVAPTTAFSTMGAIINGTLAVTMAANAVTIALKTAIGSDPSASDPVSIVFRHGTATNGTYLLRTVTAALSTVISAGSTGGTLNNTAHRIYIGAVDNAGTVELCWWNPLSTTELLTPSETELSATTAEGGAGAADSARVIYSTTARASVYLRYLGYFESTQATAGTWATPASRVQLMGPGVRRSGDQLAIARTATGAVATGTTVIPNDDTIPQNTEGDQYMTQAITPSSAINLLRISAYVNGQGSLATSVIMALFQDTTANALAAVWQEAPTTTGQCSMRLEHLMSAGTTSSTTFKIRVGGGGGTFTFNGTGGARRFGGVMASRIEITEVCV